MKGPMGIAGIALVVAAALAAGDGGASAIPATAPDPPAGERAARAMKRIIGWKWAGNWSGARDYQHSRRAVTEGLDGRFALV